jgi:hypothetical protein
MIKLTVFKNNKDFFIALLKNKNWEKEIKEIYITGFKQNNHTANTFLNYIKNDKTDIKYRLFGIENNSIIFFAFVSHNENILKISNDEKFYETYSYLEYYYITTTSDKIQINNYLFNICRNMNNKYKGLGTTVLEKFYSFLKKENITEIYLCPEFKNLETYYLKTDYQILQNLAKNNNYKLHPVMIKYLS